MATIWEWLRTLQSSRVFKKKSYRNIVPQDMWGCCFRNRATNQNRQNHKLCWRTYEVPRFKDLPINHGLLFLRMTGTYIRLGEWRIYDDFNWSQVPISTDDGYERETRGVMELWRYQLITGAHLHGWWVHTSDKGSDGIMVISVIVPMLKNYLGMPLIYLTAASFFPESEGFNVNAKLRIMWFVSLFYHQRANHEASSRPSRLLHISILS